MGEWLSKSGVNLGRRVHATILAGRRIDPGEFSSWVEEELTAGNYVGIIPLEWRIEDSRADMDIMLFKPEYLNTALTYVYSLALYFAPPPSKP